ncbi:hypothetical protein A4G27_03615 [Mycobacterium kansasii]|nr:hypothetical protein A4G27_03615 [Mycobacterium kansasii]
MHQAYWFQRERGHVAPAADQPADLAPTVVEASGNRRTLLLRADMKQLRALLISHIDELRAHR